MKKEEPYREQAERLKQRIEKINEKSDDYEGLPPRGELHRKKQAKTNLKLKYPAIRLLVVVFILLPVISFCIISYLHGKKLGVPEKVSENPHSEYETITIEKNANEGTGNSSNPKGNGSEESNEVDVTQPSQTITSPVPPAATKIAGKDSDKNSSPAQSGQVGSAAAKKMIYYTVQSQDTLFKIAIKFYNSDAGVGIIQKANDLQDQQVKEGQVLKIPFNN